MVSHFAVKARKAARCRSTIARSRSVDAARSTYLRPLLPVTLTIRRYRVILRGGEPIAVAVWVIEDFDPCIH